MTADRTVETRAAEQDSLACGIVWGELMREMERERAQHRVDARRGRRGVGEAV